jgi:hypothetical protein
MSRGRPHQPIIRCQEYVSGAEFRRGHVERVETMDAQFL